MMDLDEANRTLSARVRPGPTVSLPLRDAAGRTLAETIRPDADSPPFDRSVMDGYAVRAADVRSAPTSLRVVGALPAGAAPPSALAPGEAMQINTGAMIPPGADAVVRVEDTERIDGGEAVLIRRPVGAGRFIQTRASFRKAGSTVLDIGAVLAPAEIGACAAAGAAAVSVFRRPTVAVLSTGDELVDIDRAPTGARIRDSNRYLLEALVRSANAEPVVLASTPDDRAVLRERVARGLDHDVLCITGGVSMGAFDFVPEVLAALGVTVHIRKLAIKPGRPLLFGTAPNGSLVFALPGNPASAFVGFELLVRPALAALEGRPGALPPRVHARLCGSLSPTRERRTFTPARAALDETGAWIARPLTWGGSGDALGLAGVNALLDQPPQSDGLDAGATVSMHLIGADYARLARATADAEESA